MQPVTDTDRSTDQRTSRPRWLVPAALLGAVVVAVGLWLTQPWLLFVDTVAEETLPVTAPAPAVDETDDATDEGAAGQATEGSATSAAPSADASAADDADDASGDPAGSGDEEPATATDETDGTDGDPATTSEPAAPAGPVELAAGSFISRDHGTAGEARIVQLEDGSRVLAIEGLSTDNGPDLFVYLDDTPADGPEEGFDDGINLGRLRANQGDLLYEIPDDVDLTDVTSVGIWCDRFSSLFGAADLVPAA